MRNQLGLMAAGEELGDQYEDSRGPLALLRCHMIHQSVLISTLVPVSLIKSRSFISDLYGFSWSGDGGCCVAFKDLPGVKPVCVFMAKKAWRP